MSLVYIVASQTPIAVSLFAIQPTYRGNCCSTVSSLDHLCNSGRVKIELDNSPHIDTVATLFREYASSLPFDLTFQSFDEELAALPGEYAPPRGALIVATLNGDAAGCVALRPLDASVCEMKRLYVKPAFRGRRIAKAMCRQLILRAVTLGYQAMRLDTDQDMKEAIGL